MMDSFSAWYKAKQSKAKQRRSKQSTSRGDQIRDVVGINIPGQGAVRLIAFHPARSGKWFVWTPDRKMEDGG